MRRKAAAKIERVTNKKTIKGKICPSCKSKNVWLYMGGVQGISYKCHDCEYIGALVVEQDRQIKIKSKKE